MTPWTTTTSAAAAAAFTLTLRATPPALNATLSPPAGRGTSSWSCFGDTMQTDAWRARTCHFKDACFDRARQEFVVFTGEGQGDAPPDTSLGVFNYKWFTRYDPVFRVKVRAERGVVPRHWRLPEDELWVPHLPFAPSNIGHLIWDDYMSWFNVAWNVLPPTPQAKYALRPLWLNPNDPPWATCDWIREHEGPGHNLGAGFSQRCLKNNRKWLGTMLGEGNVVQPEVKIGPGKRTGPEASEWLRSLDPSPALVCFPDMVLGLGTMSNQGTGLHGWNVDDTVPTCGGRSPLFWEFRKHMMSMMHAPDMRPGEAKELLIFFSERSSDRIAVVWDSHRQRIAAMKRELEGMLENVVGRRIPIRVENLELASITPAEQASLASRAAIFVTVAGGGALTAQFLSRGAAIIIYHENQEQIHDGFVDWKVWNFQTSWVRASWFINKVAYDMALFEKVVREEVLLCGRFWEPLIGG